MGEASKIIRLHRNRKRKQVLKFNITPIHTIPPLLLLLLAPKTKSQYYLSPIAIAISVTVVITGTVTVVLPSPSPSLKEFPHVRTWALFASLSPVLLPLHHSVDISPPEINGEKGGGKFSLGFSKKPPDYQSIQILPQPEHF
jgi:hypothetical protein